MLTSLHIENIAVIEKAEIELGSGLNVLTGETGAGKSMVIDAINAALGERISSDVVRTGSEQALVTAVFNNISKKNCLALKDLGYPPDEDGALLIQRKISAEGKGSTCRINGQPATVSILRTIGRMLVNIHGQHENQALLSAERHVDYLEQIGELLPLHEKYSEAYGHLCDIRRQLEKTKIDEGTKARRIDMLRFQIDEIEAVGLQPGEEQELKNQRELFRNAEKIAVSLNNAHQCFSGNEEGGALAMVSDAVSYLKDAGRYVENVAEFSRRVEGILYDLEECAQELRDYSSHLDFEPNELELVEERLDRIHRLTAKYGSNEEEVLEFLEQAQQELDSIELSDMLEARLQNEFGQAKKTVLELASQLSTARRKAAADFEKKVQEQLAFLDMPGVRLKVSIETVEPGSNGIDSIEFLISANPGEAPRPLAKIASGGELSRIMLALKSVMANADDIDTLVFDEIDTGISGRAAHKVGIKLRETSKNRQVICVTHLAQIGAQADNHFLIEKTVHDGRTYTDVIALDNTGREKELARIIGGSITQATLDAAREMLAGVK
ncbi:MAG: DNA repair protein RecN [Oscillospiraceae bacterium]|nr:DNA repair protein RecN [Oscillospiraceae bacterium]MDD4413664.1 DNA repair protein RecN [Oscillospiraceae bacterium]